MIGPPIPTRLFSLVSIEDASDVAHFRTADDGREWAARQYGKKWSRELLLWDNIADRQVTS